MEGCCLASCCNPPEVIGESPEAEDLSDHLMEWLGVGGQWLGWDHPMGCCEGPIFVTVYVSYLADCQFC